MNCRRHGRKPTLALWMLVALADLAILTAAAGVLVMLTILATVAVLAGGVVAARSLSRRSEPAEAPARRRA
ncbi:hypothetical protein JIG36_42235 [Actinoplanes sp. LDG1-06]|uniref:Uncharacterized protein n=1 Tax=Paractinoplanes ovalisporus TaxID=2810368 RepID=A0ABS2AQW4_9ACTN|nr:hypothetical protein [Actinoplanes ovalisporus]MBM2622143.1 hypothetical protein [Actinoplanes ovalisporus]